MPYIGQSRSVNSANCIQNFELPLSHLSKETISNFLSSHAHLYSSDELEILSKCPISHWKFSAENYVSAGWHHTGKYFNQTTHYPLVDIAAVILSMKDTLRTAYKQDQDATKKYLANTDNLRYAYASVNRFERNGKKITYLGEYEYAGIARGEWLHFKCNSKDKTSETRKLSLYGNSVVEYKKYPDYKSLVKEHPKFKHTSAVFNQIIRELSATKKNSSKKKPSKAKKK